MRAAEGGRWVPCARRQKVRGWARHAEERLAVHFLALARAEDATKQRLDEKGAENASGLALTDVIPTT